MKITHIRAREILDSRGKPTLEVEAGLADGTLAKAGVPSGASTGTYEAHELRDEDQDRYQGQGVLTAVAHVNETLAEKVLGKDATNQLQIDQTLIEADGTPNKSRYGANALLGISLAVCRAAAQAQHQELYQYLAAMIGAKPELPQPMILVLEGGKHGNWATDIQEFMVVPKSTHFECFAEQLRAGTEIFHELEKILIELGYSTGVGFEGAYSPQEISSNEEAFELMARAIDQAGYQLGENVVLAIDAAASEFFKQGDYVLASEKNTHLSADQWTQQLISWSSHYHLWSIEDPFHEDSWEDWVKMMKEAQTIPNLQIVGDDLLTTNPKRIQQAIKNQAVNSVLIKPNQVGTLTETLEAIKMSQQAGLSTIISHRSGETNDDFIADLAVGTGAGQCKFGGPDRGERLAKYNRLAEIELIDNLL